MKIIYYDSLDKMIDGVSIFLAGPTDRDSNHTQWRLNAIEYFEKNNFSGTLISPEFEDKEKSINYDYSYFPDWEEIFLQCCDYILFWIPRDLEKLPGFTTNVEFGKYYQDKRVYIGSPIDSPKNRYLKHIYERDVKKYWYNYLDTMIIDICSEVKRKGY
jgi:hypothetical protein